VPCFQLGNHVCFMHNSWWFQKGVFTQDLVGSLTIPHIFISCVKVLLLSLARSDLILNRRKGSGTWPWSLRNLISTVTHDSFPLSLLSRGVGIVGATGARAHFSLQQAVVKKIAKSYNKPICQVWQCSAAAYAASARTWAHIWCALFRQFQHFIDG